MDEGTASRTARSVAAHRLDFARAPVAGLLAAAGVPEEAARLLAGQGWRVIEARDRLRAAGLLTARATTRPLLSPGGPQPGFAPLLVVWAPPPIGLALWAPPPMGFHAGSLAKRKSVTPVAGEAVTQPNPGAPGGRRRHEAR